MKKLLKKQNEEIYYYKDNVKTVIDRNNKTTYPVNIYGNITSGLSGDITGLTGNISGLKRTKDRNKY